MGTEVEKSKVFTSTYEIIDYIQEESELIQQFKGASDETNVELSVLIKDFCNNLSGCTAFLDDLSILHNWECCGSDSSKRIRGQVYNNNDFSGKLINFEVLSINDSIVRTQNEAFILGMELGYEGPVKPEKNKERKRDKVKQKAKQKIKRVREISKEQMRAQQGILLIAALIGVCVCKYFFC